MLKWEVKSAKKHANERPRSDRKREERSFGFQRGDKLKEESGARTSCLQGVHRESNKVRRREVLEL